MKKSDFFSEFKPMNFLMLFIAGIINAVGVNLFLAPVHLYDSGISGTSMLFSWLIPAVPMSVFLIILNVPLFIFGTKMQGMHFTVYSIFAVIIYSAASYVLTYLCGFDLSAGSPITKNDLLLCAIFGGLISGVGSGLTIRFGGAIDGIEVMAVIFAKKLGLTVGTFVMIYNLILYIICGVVLNSWILPLYSIVAYSAALKTVDFIIEGIDRAKCAIIITEFPDRVCDTLSETFGKGLTRLKAKGGYSNRDKSMIYFVVNRYQVVRMKDIVHTIDPTAYIIISEVVDVFSNNGDENNGDEK